MPLTAEQSYALGTREGRDRINQQLRANPQYTAYLQSIGVNASGPMQLTDQQRKQAADWVRQNQGGIGGLEIDPAGNLNNPHGFAQEFKQWGPVALAAGGVAAPFVLPALVGAAGGGAAGGTLASSSIPASLSMYGPAAIASQGASLAVPGALAAGGTLASHAVPSAWTQLMMNPSSVPGTVTSQGVSSAGGGGMGWLDTIRKAKDYYDMGSDIYGSAAGRASQQMASNRGEKLSAQMDLERILQDRERQLLERQVLREREGRESGTDAFKRLMAAQRLGSPGAQPMLSPYSVAPRARTGAEREGADAMTLEVMKRLRSGNPIPEQTQHDLAIDMGLANSGGWEDFLGYSGAAAQAYGSRNRPLYVRQA